MDCDRAKRAALRRLTACLVAAATAGISAAHATEKEDPVCVKPITGNVTGFTFPDGDPPDNPLTPPQFTACDAANMT